MTSSDITSQEVTITCVEQNKSITKSIAEVSFYMSTSMITTGSLGIIQAAGITAQKKFIPAVGKN